MATPVFDTLLGDMVMHEHPASGAAEPITDTRANILAMSPASPVFAQSTDYNDLFFWNGSAWLLVPFPFVAANANPDMGAYQDSSRIGLHANYVDDKLLTRITIGTTYNNTRDGELRYDPSAAIGAGFFGRIGGAFAKFVTGIVLRELSSRLQFQPSGSSEWYDVARMNSTSVGLNGLPITQDGQTSMGAYPAPLIIDGGNKNMDNPSTTTLLLHGTIFRLRCRRMTEAERAAMVAGHHAEGELIYATDTKKLYVSDGAGGMTALN